MVMMRQVWLFAALLAIFLAMCFYVSKLHAVTLGKYPCTPMFLAGPQGRPLPTTVTMVTDLNLVQQTVYLDTLGNGATTNPIVPQNTQILQFYVDLPGEYITTVTSSGTTKQFWVSCGIGVGSGVKQVSIDRTADLLLLNTSNPPTLACATNKPCILAFSKIANPEEFAIFDFVMPTAFPETFESILLQWHAALAFGNVVWDFNWCTYKVGEPPCDVTDTATWPNTVVLVSTATGAMTRQDLTVPATFVPTGAWPQGVHVVIRIQRDVFDPRDGNVEAEFENVQMEFSR